MVKLEVSAPEMFPPLERFVPFLRHWYVGAGVPEAVTEKITENPTHTQLWPLGCVAIDGAVHAELKVAVQLLSSHILTVVDVEVPLQFPLQLAKTEPRSASAVRVTYVPWLYDSAQSPGQSMPVGLLVTVPLPTTVTVRVFPALAFTYLKSSSLLLWVSLPL